MTPSTVNGVVLGPDSPLQTAARGCRSEKAETALCDDLVARISGRDGVVALSQLRASMVTIGLSDRRYRAHGASFFFEVKAADGQLTRSQHLFLLAELAHGALAGCGTLDDLVAYLAALQSNHRDYWAMNRHSVDLINRWVAKGYRPERSPRRRRGRRS